MTTLEKPLGDLRRELADLRRSDLSHNYNPNRLITSITASKDCLQNTEAYQQKILEQLKQFEICIADMNEILQTNSKQNIELEQHQESADDIEMRAKVMELNAEALECRAAAVKLQQDAKVALAKAAELKKRTNEQLAQQTQAMKLKQQELERDRAAELERRVRQEEERQRLNELQIQQQQKERLAVLAKMQQQDEYTNWKERDLMNDDQYPQCIFRLAPNNVSLPIDVSFLKVSDTEHLLDSHEELISTPIEVKFNTTGYEQQVILLSIPYIIPRSTHRESVIKIRQANGTWTSIDTKESTFDAHKDKRFAECKLSQSSSCAVVSRLKCDMIFINKQSPGRFSSTADPRLTMQWPAHVSSTDLNMNLRVLPVELSTFTQFSKAFTSECQGLIAVGPVIELQFDDVTLLKPIQFTLPILVQAKKSVIPTKVATDETPTINKNELSQQEINLKQQESIFKSLLSEVTIDSGNERLALLYYNQNDNVWRVDTNVHLMDSKTHDTITTNLQYLYNRMIIARYDKQFISTKQLPIAIGLLEQSLSRRSVSLIVRHRSTNPNQICFVCCSTRRKSRVDAELEKENFVDNEEEQAKQISLEEGQLLELRFRGNVLPNESKQQSHSFAFNTYYPFYFQTDVHEIDKYSQHLASFFYGFIQVYTKQKVGKPLSKELEKKNKALDMTKLEWHETDVCIAELVVRLQKPREAIRIPTPKAFTTFGSEGIITPSLFHEISATLNGDEWRRLARRLGMTRIRIEAIANDYPDDPVYYMLLTWFKRAPRSVDKELLLIHAFMQINRWDIAQELQTMKEAKRQELNLSSKDELLKIFQMPFNRICQYEECVRMWKQIARALKLPNENIRQIENKYTSRHERCLRSLEYWALHENQPDLRVLAHVMNSLGFKYLGRELDSMT